MSKYRKKPVEVEAVRFEKPYWKVTEFCPSLRMQGRGLTGRRIAFGIISTLEGDMRAELGDWIIRGVQGEFYPCKPDIFEQTYEAVHDD